MSAFMNIIFIAVGVIALILIGMFFLIIKFFRKVEQGQALIVNTMRTEPIVTFTGKAVIPVVHKAEVMDISIKTIDIDRRGREGLICKDNIRADIKVAFFVRVNKTVEDVLKVAQAIGCERASDPATLEELFSAKFSEALKTVGKQLDFEDLYKERDSFRDKIIEVIGKDLNGYVLEDAAIDYLEQTPLQVLDGDNILDAQGIRKITELTAVQHVHTNNAQREEQMRIKQKDVQAREAILEMERQQEDAENKQRREVENIRAREEAEIGRVAAEERLKAEMARIQTDEKLAIDEENKQREVEVAQKNRERAVAVEIERVERARALEAIDRQREVELQEIAKEKALEVERKAIADVVRQRVAVDKTVAEEEERIKELRLVAEADRSRQAKVIEAEGEAQQRLVQDIKAAEAQEEAAKHKARERVTLAEAELEAAEKQAQSQTRLAEGQQAELAAEGLAQARVTEASALAQEKEGLAEARVLLERRSAEAQGLEQVGLAEAKVLLERQQSEAKGLEDKGMAEVRVQEEHANVVEREGLADAHALKEKMLAEATGLTEKIKAMQSMGDAGREFEELRLKLELAQAVQLASIDAGKAVAHSQTRVLGEALRSAKIDIVGGETVFFDRLVNSVSLGKSMDKLAQGETVQTLFKDYLAGDGNLVGDVKEVLSGLSSEDLRDLSLSALIARLMAGSSGERQTKLRKLLTAAKDLEAGGK